MDKLINSLYEITLQGEFKKKYYLCIVEMLPIIASK